MKTNILKDLKLTFDRYSSTWDDDSGTELFCANSLRKIFDLPENTNALYLSVSKRRPRDDNYIEIMPLGDTNNLGPFIWGLQYRLPEDDCWISPLTMYELDKLMEEKDMERDHVYYAWVTTKA